MIQNKDGTYCAINKIIGNDRQLTITIPNSDWKYFDVGSKVKVVSSNNKEFYRRIRLIGSGKQRNISVPKEEWTTFKKGDKVRIFPEKQPSQSAVSKSQDSMDKQKNGKSLHPESNL